MFIMARNIIYWIATALTAFVFLSGGVNELLRPGYLMQGMTHLGYPAYFVLILGVWKILGGLTVLVPRFPMVKEWAYAGMFFDLTGAAASHAAVGDPAVKVATPLIIVGIVIASWALRPASRKVQIASVTPEAAPEGSAHSGTGAARV
jgi:uncharacterized membrane protein YphA (DoxX/SURF4 family)